MCRSAIFPKIAFPDPTVEIAVLRLRLGYSVLLLLVIFSERPAMNARAHGLCPMG